MLRLYSAAVIGLLVTTRAAAWDVPPGPARQFDDRAGFVGPEVSARLEARLRSEREKTGREVVVAIFPRLPDGAVLEDFCVRTAQAWRVGRSAQDDGVVLFVFAADRRLRLEVGYGLEAVLPDVTAKRILDDVMAPHLRAGDNAAALEAGVEAILTAAAGGEVGGAPPSRADLDLAGDDYHRLAALPLLVVLWVFFFGSRKRKKKADIGDVSPGTALAVVVGIVAVLAGLVLDAEAALRGAAFLAGAGVAAALFLPRWASFVGGRKGGASSRPAGAAVTAVSALIAVLQLAVAFGARASVAGWGVPALASISILLSFCALGVWRAKLWSERILYLGLGSLIAAAYVQPSLMDGRFPTFILVFPWAPIWTGVAVMLNGVFEALGLKPRRWWYDDSGRQAGLAGGAWSGGGYESSGGYSGGSGYSGGGGSFGGGGASGRW